MILYQVNRFMCRQNLVRQVFRGLHNEQQSTKILYPLKSRNLIKICGNEASVFLQGLITNDMRHFEEGANSMYAMFLNTKGRMLYDVLIHKKNTEESFVLECDKNITAALQKHLKIYKLKRKVDIIDVSKEFNLWALISPTDTAYSGDVNGDVHIYKDPRLADLGSRIITSATASEDVLKSAVGNNILLEDSDDGYRYLRYKLGVSEGADELPPGTSFPLEVNCDYLHGVSFHKGCYIGQELTARVHHTGVVRKRIMPLKFNETVVDLEKDAAISASDTKSSIGKLKGFLKDYGIGLVRIKEGLEAKAANIGKYSVEVVKPSWWPIEAPKEKSPLVKE